MDKIGILAGNYNEYKHFMTQPEIGEHCEYIYFNHPDKVRGYELQDYKIIGTFWDRPDAGKLEQAVKERIR